MIWPDGDPAVSLYDHCYQVAAITAITAIRQLGHQVIMVIRGTFHKQYYHQEAQGQTGSLHIGPSSPKFPFLFIKLVFPLLEGKYIYIYIESQQYDTLWEEQKFNYSKIMRKIKSFFFQTHLLVREKWRCVEYALFFACFQPSQNDKQQHN